MGEKEGNKDAQTDCQLLRVSRSLKSRCNTYVHSTFLCVFLCSSCARVSLPSPLDSQDPPPLQPKSRTPAPPESGCLLTTGGIPLPLDSQRGHPDLDVPPLKIDMHLACGKDRGVHLSLPLHHLLVYLRHLPPHSAYFVSSSFPATTLGMTPREVVKTNRFQSRSCPSLPLHAHSRGERCKTALAARERGANHLLPRQLRWRGRLVELGVVELVEPRQSFFPTQARRAKAKNANCIDR